MKLAVVLHLIVLRNGTKDESAHSRTRRSAILVAVVLRAGTVRLAATGLTVRVCGLRSQGSSDEANENQGFQNRTSGTGVPSVKSCA
jgi:hypothetical protein